jgi:hypothetical protein
MLTPPPFCLKKSAGDVGLFRVGPALHLSDVEWTKSVDGHDRAGYLPRDQPPNRARVQDLNQFYQPRAPLASGKKHSTYPFQQLYAPVTSYC